MKNKPTLILAFLLICCLSCSENSGIKSLKLGHGLDVTHPVHKGMVYMAERLAEKSGGKLVMEIYPSEQLGKERQLLELLQIGSLAMTKVSGAVMENFSPNIKVLSLPYIFKGKEHAHKIFDGEIGKKLLIESEQYRLRGLVYFDAGQRSFYTKERPVNHPDSLQGLKIRVQESATAMNMVRAMGGAPTPIPMGDLHNALQTGVVDGAENNPPTFYTSSHYQVCKYYCLNEHTAVPDILIIGTDAWNRLSDQEKEWVQAAADEAKVFQRKLWAEAEQEALDAVEKAGVEIIRPEKEPFAEKVKETFESYRSEPEVYQLIQQIQAID